MAVRNLNNQPMGANSKQFAFRMDYKTEQIFRKLRKAGMNVSQFIRMAVLEYWEVEIMGKYEEMVKEYEKREAKKKERLPNS